jgi:hypothetical protein
LKLEIVRFDPESRQGLLTGLFTHDKNNIVHFLVTHDNTPAVEFKVPAKRADRGFDPYEVPGQQYHRFVSAVLHPCLPLFLLSLSS